VWLGNNEVNVNVSKQNNFTKNNYNNSEKYQKKQNGKNQSWQHNPENRKGAKYPNQNTAQKYGQQRSGSGGRATTSDARVMAVAEGREAAEGLRPATSVVAARVQQGTEAVESPKRATSVVVEARRVRLVAAAEEANGRPAIAVRRAAALPHAARAVRGGRRAPQRWIAQQWWGSSSSGGGSRGGGGGEDVGKQEIEKNKG